MSYDAQLFICTDEQVSHFDTMMADSGALNVSRSELVRAGPAVNLLQ